jgi:ligand-binding SRPBCC domain-containing protein
MGFRIVSLPSEVLYEGEIIEYSVKVLPGIWIPWVSEIKALRKGESFVDDQISGPFKFWHHRHSFEETRGGTIVKDLIHYSVGFSIFGEVARALVVKNQLAKMFEHRRLVMEDKFGKVT